MKNIKTAEEILQNNHSPEYSHEFVLEAMEEYANQFRPEWVSVSKTMPEHEVEVIGLTKQGNICKVACDRLNGDIFYNPYTMVRFFNITHWMPLPQPPQK